LVSFLTL